VRERLRVRVKVRVKVRVRARVRVSAPMVSSRPRARLSTGRRKRDAPQKR
jgi:hypothetical protein